MDASVASLRREYSSQSLLETDIEKDAIAQFDKWWQQAIAARLPEPNAMTLATASSDGMPSARIVLLKGYSADGFVFFTNYKSYKAMQLDENPKACLVFFWTELERQIRITGLVRKLPAADSNAYYLSRPKGSQLGAWASPQSQVIPSRDWLDEAYLETEAAYNGKELQRPEHWGGYLVQPVIIEFWQGRPSRLHDRIQYSLQENGQWKAERLAP